jgi:branched-chain amino acid transport system substrate-binding protein
MKFRRILLILWLPMLCTCSSRHPDTLAIPVGIIAPLTGDYAYIGGETIDGAQLAVDQLNRENIEVGGKRIRLAIVAEDNGDRPDQAVSKAFKLINLDGVVALLGLPFSHNAVPVSAVAEQKQVPMISTKSSNLATTAGKRFAYRMAFLDTFQGMLMAQFLFEDLGIGRAAILYDRAITYSRDLAASFAGSYEQMGGETTAVFSYTTDAPEVTAELAQIAASGAQALFLPNYPDHVLEHGKEFRRLSAGAVLVGSDSWNGRAFSAHSEFRDAVYSEVWAVGIESEASREFVDGFQAVHGRLPLAEAALAYDAVQILVEAVRLARSADPKRIQEALSSMRAFEGVTGILQFDGDRIARSAVIMKITGVSEPVVAREWHPR